MQDNSQNTSITTKIINWSINNLFLNFLLILTITIVGIYSVKNIPIDALPDITETQIIIKVDYNGQSPQIIEDSVTYPISRSLLGLPKVKNVRATSMFGNAFIYIIFEDGTDQYWARNLINERLSSIDIPQDVKAIIGPDATGVGWIYQYILEDKSKKHDLSELRSIQEWFLKYELSTVKGVAEVASVGGIKKEYQIQLNPHKLKFYNIALTDIKNAVKLSNQSVSGLTLEQSETEFLIQSDGYISNINDIREIIISYSQDSPILLSDIAIIKEISSFRRGVTDYNGEGEVVSGIVIMRSGENVLQTIRNIENKIKSLENSLPEGVSIKEIHNRAPLINQAITYISTKLLEETIVVILVCFIFLLHFRSSLIAVITLPLGILCAIITMKIQGLSINIMSLGGIAIAIGTMIDSSIIMTENCHRKLASLGRKPSKHERKNIIFQALKEVSSGVFLSLIIITISFLPIFFLQGESYKLFAPLAYTKTYAMLFAAILSITTVPALLICFLHGKLKRESDSHINKHLTSIYKSLLNFSFNNKLITVILTVILCISVYIPLSNSKTEFMPPFYEGEILYMPTTLPSISPMKAKEILQKTNQLIRNIPEVDSVFGKAGRADTATDPAPISMIESWIKLKPESQWRPHINRKTLIKELDTLVKLPSLTNSWGYPIKIRTDMVSTGIRTALGIKISGDQPSEISKTTKAIQKLLSKSPEIQSIFNDRGELGKYIKITPNRKKMAQTGASMKEIQSAISLALGAQKLGESVEGRQRYPISMRYEDQYRSNINDINNIYIKNKHGNHLLMSEVADIRFSESPTAIHSENARLNRLIFINLKEDQPVTEFIKKANDLITKNIKLENSSSIEWVGKFKEYEKSTNTLTTITPLILLIILALLYIYFKKISAILLVILSAIFASIGGIWSIYIAGYNFSVATNIGLISLSGVAIETAIIMIIYINNQLESASDKTSKRAITNTIMKGAALRLRPKIMTVSTIFIGLLPIFFSDGIGSDIMKRIALPMVGGIFFTSIFTLFILPTFYAMLITEKRRK